MTTRTRIIPPRGNYATLYTPIIIPWTSVGVPVARGAGSETVSPPELLVPPGSNIKGSQEGENTVGGGGMP